MCTRSQGRDHRGIDPSFSAPASPSSSGPPPPPPPRGRAGQQGLNGQPGQAGQQGPNGQPGQAGQQGPNGQPGPAGQQGANVPPGPTRRYGSYGRPGQYGGYGQYGQPSDGQWAQYMGQPWGRDRPRGGSHWRRLVCTRRNRDDRILGGVAGGIARSFGVDPMVVRIVLVIAAFVVGFGLAGYMIAWLVIPLDGEERNIASKAVQDRRGIALALALLSGLAVVAIVSSLAGASWVGSIGWPTFIGAAAFVLIWRNAPAEERDHIQQATDPLLGLGFLTGRSKLAVILRFAVGIVLIATGLILLARGHSRLTVIRPLFNILCVIAGFIVLLLPWWLRIVRDLIDERRARAVAEDRAEIAARVHDSVLQTLALIQRRADNPGQVRQLARAQERELRSWLFEGGPGPVGEDDAMLAQAVERIVREVEAAHGVPVEGVTVGDCELDDDLRELLAAGREAAVNAAKWSGAPEISVFAEVEPTRVSMFVRDRGVGFEAEDVSPDRRGISESIHGRMARHGGKAKVRSSPGQGTEVALSMPRPGAKRRSGEARV